MRTIMYRAFLGCALFAVLLSTMSCTTRTRYLTVRPPHALPTEGEALPLTAALVLPDAVRNATDQEQISCPFSTTAFVFQIGSGFEKGALVPSSRFCCRRCPVRHGPAISRCVHRMPFPQKERRFP